MALPVAQIKWPADLVDVPNGEVPEHLLAGCGVKSYYAPYAELKMHHLAARAMRAMVAALCASLGYTSVQATGTLRTYDQQVRMFDGTDPRNRSATTGRYIPESLWSTVANLTTDLRSWLAKRWKRRSGTASAAVPGTSNHGKAVAIDFAVTVPMVNWLIANAHRFGYSAEIQSENWHWRYVAGDAIPDAVLAYERSLDPAPVTRSAGLELIAMYQIALKMKAGKLVCRVTADEIIHEVNGDAEKIDVRAGVHQEPVTKAELLGMLAGGRRTVGWPFGAKGGPWWDAELAKVWKERQG